MSKSDPYAVRQVRGPYLKQQPHENHCVTVEELKRYCQKRRKAGVLLGADLFSGAGGLSLGLAEAGIEVVFGVDHYDYAVETHAAQFPGMSVDWDLSTADSVERVAKIMRDCGIEVLAGGPPCQPFSKAGRSGIRNLVRRGERDPYDARRDLWRAYLEVVVLARPRAVIMENVPDMALDREMFIIRSIIEELEQLGYSVEERVIEAWRYGVPQFRQRLIVVALRDDLKYNWPRESQQKVTLWNAIGDMPEVAGGWRPEGGAQGWIEYDGPVTDFQAYLRRRVSKKHANRLYDHLTRPVREDDKEAFEMMTPDTKYSQLPTHLRRYRSDIFDDKYKRLDENDLSRTITAHIAKDGYGFIHPRQARTLTVREAARIQTFPDDFRFSGPPSAAFRQIGNAVPVRLGEAIATGVVTALEENVNKKDSAREISRLLADWYQELPERALVFPWARSDSRWKAALAEIVLERVSLTMVRSLWPLIKELPEPDVNDGPVWETIDVLKEILECYPAFQKKIERLCSFGNELALSPGALDAPTIDCELLPSLPQVSANYLELAIPRALNGQQSEEPVMAQKGVLRVTSRYQGVDSETRNRQTEGRLSVARMLGMNENSREAQLALIELARTICTPEFPRCTECPLASSCKDFGSIKVGGNQKAFKV